MDPHFWFVVGRIGGLTSWFLLAGAVICGLAQSTRWVGAKPAGKYVYLLHQKLSVLAIVFVIVHMVGLLANTTLLMRLTDLVVPFASPFQPRDDVAFGVIAFWLLLAVQLSSQARRHIPAALWRWIHTASFALFALADIHSFTLGFDIPNPAVRWTAVSFTYLIGFGMLFRLIALVRGGRRPATALAGAGGPSRPGGPGGPGGGIRPAARPAPATASAAGVAPRPAAPAAPVGATVRSVASAPSARANVPRFHRLTINDVAWETNEATSVRFDVPPELADVFKFKPGQFVTLRATLDGREVRRAYSISSGIADGELRVAVKRVEQGQMSNWVNAWLQVGAVVEVMPPMGRFTAEVNPLASRHVLGVAAGIGITPVISIAKSVLTVEPHSRVTLIYGNRDEVSTVFRGELNRMQERFSGRLRVLHVLSKGHPDTPLLRGRITARKLHELAAWGVDFRTVDDAYVCAPDRMTTEVSQTLVKLGMSAAKVHSEEYGVAERAQAVAVGGAASPGPSSLASSSAGPASLAGPAGPAGAFAQAAPGPSALAAPPAAPAAGMTPMATVTPMARAMPTQGGGLAGADRPASAGGVGPAGGVAAGAAMTVICAGASADVPVAPGQTILDAGLAAGMDLPYSCRTGVCGACRAAVVQGEVAPGSSQLSPAETAAGFVMSCQATPIGGGVVVSFDN